MKYPHLLFGLWSACSVGLAAHVLAEPAPSAVSFNDGAEHCDVYELAEGAHRDAIADMLADAAERVKASGCVNIEFVEA